MKGDVKDLYGDFGEATYIEFSFKLNKLYVCDQGNQTLFSLDIEIGDDGLGASNLKSIMSNFSCAGMQFDKFGNLFFVDKGNYTILQIPHYQLSDDSRSSYLPIPVYSVNSTETVHMPEGLAIEREYLYWTNRLMGQTYGGIHKGFTKPFVRAVPF